MVLKRDLAGFRSTGFWIDLLEFSGFRESDLTKRKGGSWIARGCVWGGGGGFYIFTIITNGTRQIIIFKLAPTTIPIERSLTYNFTTFAHVASHTGMTRWHPVSSLVSNVLHIPDLLLSLPL